MEDWVQFLCFWKAFHLILMHFIPKIQCFEEFLHKIALFFKNLFFFQNFERSNLFFDRSKLRLKFWSASVYFDRCSIAYGSIEAFLIDRIFFSINWKSRWEFFKKFCFHVFYTISNFFKTLFSLIRSIKATKAIFCCFLQNFCKVFLSQGR